VQREALARGEARPAANDDAEALQMVACGRPLPRHQVRIVDSQGGELPPRHVGRLEFRGPSATRGYYRNAEATALLMHDGWLDSGDLAYLADGDIYIAGRLKDMIIRGGRNLYPYELEEAVGGIAGIRRGCVAVFGANACGGRNRAPGGRCRMPRTGWRRARGTGSPDQRAGGRSARHPTG
jgi:acyl-CoA synthetase (AMP-forming)/AMP-acid ligase II